MGPLAATVYLRFATFAQLHIGIHSSRNVKFCSFSLFMQIDSDLGCSLRVDRKNQGEEIALKDAKT